MTNEDAQSVEEHIEDVNDHDLLVEILAELRQINQNLTSRTVSDRMNEEMDLIK